MPTEIGAVDGVGKPGVPGFGGAGSGGRGMTAGSQVMVGVA